MTTRSLVMLLVTLAGSSVFAQSTLKSVDVVQPYNGTSLKIDLALPAADRVSSIDISANGTPVDKDKVKFTPADKLPNYHCAILLLVDKTLGNNKDTTEKTREKLWKSIRDTMGKFSAVAETAPYQVGVATFSAGNLEMMAAMGSKKSIVDSAIEKITFNGVSPELYLGTKRAIEWFGGTPADRKYIVLISDGISNDKVISQQDVVQAALKAKVHICTVGFPKSTEARDGVQRLDPLADETGGYPLRADGSDPKLPADAESNLLKFVVSGGQAEIALSAPKGTVNVTGKVQTEFGKLYTFAQSVESNGVAESTPVRSEEQPPAPESRLASFKAKLREHPVLAILGGAALLVAVILLGLLVSRAAKSAQPEPLPPEPFPPVMDPPMESEDTQMPEPAATVYAWLVTLDADETRYPITKAAVRIGRKPDNDIVMKNNSVSSHHAEVIKRGDKFIIADLEASNGVFIGGKRVDKTPLADGDVIELGEVRLRFTLNSPEN
ncbi:MAG: FHA domain-containing protein [Chthoniobacter sp.]|uniref:FHA domain-containing protein n=1 Tax=Chthoniobacter sp. TaxID=2510640 RepID=UPI0032AAB96A